MELIIKPTSVCNFACTFCSAGLLNIKKVREVPQKIVELINLLKPQSVIITGGDPLCIDRRYYEHLLQIYDGPISFTSNLKGYYLNREYWKPILSNNRIGVGTSFQYGNERLWDKNTSYTEEMFIKVMTQFESDFGYVPSFISVITPDNVDRAIDHVYLAKRLNTKCKLNPLKSIGKSVTTFPLYKMIDIYNECTRLGLDQYLDHDIQYRGGCGWNTGRMCESCIRACWIDNNDQLHYSHCEELLSWGIEIPTDTTKPKPIPHTITLKEVIKPQCYQCRLFNLCNGCAVHREQAKCDPNYCEQMKAREQLILSRKDWKIE